MKTLSALFLLVLSAFPAQAADPWTTEQKALGWTWGALQTVDYLQTRYIAKHPDRFKEVNAAGWIGEKPSTRDVTAYFAASSAFKLTVMHYLPSPWRTGFQYVNIVYTGATVYHNHRIGIRLDFPL